MTCGSSTARRADGVRKGAMLHQQYRGATELSLSCVTMYVILSHAEDTAGTPAGIGGVHQAAQLTSCILPLPCVS